MPLEHTTFGASAVVEYRQLKLVVGRTETDVAAGGTGMSRDVRHRLLNNPKYGGRRRFLDGQVSGSYEYAALDA